MADPRAHLIPRETFAARYFPQAACHGPERMTETGPAYPHPCRYLSTCTAMLSVPVEAMHRNVWMVRGEGECARNFFTVEPRDVRNLRQREARALAELQDENA